MNGCLRLRRTGHPLFLQVGASHLLYRVSLWLVGRGNVYATQFHPEKSGTTGLAILKAFLEMDAGVNATAIEQTNSGTVGLAKRVIACLDVRSNDAGDLVVTKVQEKISRAFSSSDRIG